jgi:hypothetical protein
VRETTVEKYLREQVEARGGLCEKFVSPGRRGVPDRLVTWPEGYSDDNDTLFFYGFMDLVETKAPNGRLRGSQVRDHKRRRLLGIIVFVASTKEQVDEYIKARGR